MAADDGQVEFVAQHRLGDCAQAFGIGVAVFIDMEVEAEAALAGEGEEAVELERKPGGHLQEAPEGARAVADGEVGDFLADRRGVVGPVAERNGLEGDAAGPNGAEFSHDRMPRRKRPARDLLSDR